MNTAWSLSLAFWSPVQRALRGLLPGAGPAAARRRTVPHAASNRPVRAMAPADSACRRPLRVVRIVDNGADRSQPGRLVISGRMADVCAELDRLAALEALHS